MGPEIEKALDGMERSGMEDEAFSISPRIGLHQAALSVFRCSCFGSVS